MLFMEWTYGSSAPPRLHFKLIGKRRRTSAHRHIEASFQVNREKQEISAYRLPETDWLYTSGAVLTIARPLSEQLW